MPVSKEHSPTAIFVHGAGGGGWEWIVWQRMFGAYGWSVLAPDLQPAAGGLAATHIEDYAAQVRAWRGNGGEKPALIGASLGGLLALVSGAATDVAALVLINPIPPAGIVPRPLRTDFPDLVPWGRERSLAGTRRALPDADDATCLYAGRRWRDESGGVLRAAAAGIDVDPPRARTLVLGSERDADVPVAASAALAASFGAEFRLLPGASHVGPLLGRDAAATAEAVCNWLRDSH